MNRAQKGIRGEEETLQTNLGGRAKFQKRKDGTKVRMMHNLYDPHSDSPRNKAQEKIDDKMLYDDTYEPSQAELDAVKAEEKDNQIKAINKSIKRNQN